MPHYLPIQWVDGHLRLLDQRELPARVTFIDYVDPRAVAEAITAMVVRGAHRHRDHGCLWAGSGCSA